MIVKERIGDIIETDVIDLAFNGKSVGSLNGKIIFLNGGLPGEKVQARIVKKKARFSIAKVLSIVEKSKERVVAQCSHFDLCGGCTWQDLDYDRQLYYKRKQVVDCLAHIGRIGKVDVAETIPSADRYYYRNKMEYSFNVNGDRAFSLGLHQRGHYDRIFDLKECLLQSEISNEIVNWFREYVTNNRIPVYDISNHIGFLRFLVIREAKKTGQIMLNLVTADGAIPDAEKLIAEITGRFPRIVTIVQNINNGKSNVARGEREIALYGKGFIEEELLGSTFIVYANSFFQTNSRQAELLYSKAYELLDPTINDRFLDLYCGTGTIGICISSKVSGVVGIELEPSAIAAAKENAERNGIKNVEFYTGAAEKIMKDKPEIFEGITCAIIDPPRAGMHRQALKRLLDLRLPRIVYISCNPATFSRDAMLLLDSEYTMSQIIPVDMFPHTMHIELVAGFYK